MNNNEAESSEEENNIELEDNPFMEIEEVLESIACFIFWIYAHKNI